ncbi:enoyl-CoA hydratase/isomerase family protein [Gammaproteobacteria bacterium]|nr:enoyl-CoA hydratase/isomerase family protein [Gammaproteobacteria bacterium]
MDYEDYQYLRFERQGKGILLVKIDRPEVLNATNARLHNELTCVWSTLGRDHLTNVVVITGEGDKAFSAGGDIELIEGMIGNSKEIARIQTEARDLVYNILAFEKPIISAINGVAVGAGLAVALLSDISVMNEDARLSDGHTKLGVGAGDHAAIIWPLLCGMAKAKYYLMTADFISGIEAERLGLVTFSKPSGQVLPFALEIADKLAKGSQPAIRGTKQTLNGWLKQASPIFEDSLRMEMFGFLGKDAQEGLSALKEKRVPKFSSADLYWSQSNSDG